MPARQTRTPRKAKNPLPAAAGVTRAAQAPDLEEAALHELDYEDVALSGQALRLVRRAATGLLRRFLAVEDDELSPARALALFLDKVLWDERSGGLILCAEFPGQRFCLPIPSGEWGLRRRTGPPQ